MLYLGGPNSNFHGPDEALDLVYAQQLTCCVASIIASHAAQPFVAMAPTGLNITPQGGKRRRKAADLSAAAAAASGSGDGCGCTNPRFGLTPASIAALGRQLKQANM